MKLLDHVWNSNLECKRTDRHPCPLSDLWLKVLQSTFGPFLVGLYDKSFIIKLSYLDQRVFGNDELSLAWFPVMTDRLANSRWDLIVSFEISSDLISLKYRLWMLEIRSYLDLRKNLRSESQTTIDLASSMSWTGSVTLVLIGKLPKFGIQTRAKLMHRRLISQFASLKLLLIATCNLRKLFVERRCHSNQKCDWKYEDSVPVEEHSNTPSLRRIVIQLILALYLIENLSTFFIFLLPRLWWLIKNGYF